jgi:hypothetical protein
MPLMAQIIYIPKTSKNSKRTKDLISKESRNEGNIYLTRI